MWCVFSITGFNCSVFLPGARIEEFLYEKLDRKVPYRATNGEILGQYMLEAAKEFGAGTPYGNSERTDLKIG